MSPQRYVSHTEELTVFAADGQAVMFDPRDGGLHLLAELPWAVLCCLQDMACDADTLKQRLQADYPDDDPVEQAAAADSALRELLLLGLVQAQSE